MLASSFSVLHSWKLLNVDWILRLWRPAVPSDSWVNGFEKHLVGVFQLASKRLWGKMIYRWLVDEECKCLTMDGLFFYCHTWPFFSQYRVSGSRIENKSQDVIQIPSQARMQHVLQNWLFFTWTTVSYSLSTQRQEGMSFYPLWDRDTIARELANKKWWA